MKRAGKGIPVWRPDPSSSSTNGAQIGDVGYMKNGDFYQLFNIIEGWSGTDRTPLTWKWERPIASANVQCTLGELSAETSRTDTRSTTGVSGVNRTEVVGNEETPGRQEATDGQKQGVAQ